MSESTPRYSLSLLVAGQGQKDITHNEALLQLDSLLHPIVEERGRSAPPPEPMEGQTWLIGDGPEGAWHGHAGALATWTAGGWRFARPAEGLVLIDGPTSGKWRRQNGEWRAEIPYAAAPAAIPAPVGGATVDVEARLAVTAILAQLRLLGFVT